MASLNYEKAQELWSSFYNVVMFHHRYLISHSMLDKLKEIAKECEKRDAGTGPCPLFLNKNPILLR